MENKIQELAAIIKKTYSNISPELVDELFSDLKDIIEDTSLPLVDIILIVDEFEESLDVKCEDTHAYNILDEVLYILEDNEENANRLYEFVTDNCEWFLAINKLLLYNDQHLSDTQIQRILPVAKGFGFQWDSQYREWSWNPQ